MTGRCAVRPRLASSNRCIYFLEPLALSVCIWALTVALTVPLDMTRDVGRHQLPQSLGQFQPGYYADLREEAKKEGVDIEPPGARVQRP